MKQPGIAKKVVRLTVLFLVLLGLLLGGLCLTALIPREALKPQLQSSLDKLEGRALFQPLLGGRDFSKQDNYADVIWLNVAYNIDSAHPLRAVLADDYVDSPTVEADDDLQNALNGAAPDTSYARYWHGVMLFLRPLLLVLDLQGIRTLNAVVMAVLFAGILAGLLRKKRIACAAIFTTAAAVNALWLTPVSLEYTPTVLLALAMCLAVPWANKKGPFALTALFLTAGVLTNFFDFLTTETLPAVLPLALLTVLRYEDGDLKDWKTEAPAAIKLLVVFALAYALTWLSKWALASLVTGTNVFADAIAAAEERTAGSVEIAMGGVNLDRFTGAILRNWYCLFPALFAKTYAQVGVITLVLAVALASVFYLVRRDLGEKKTVCLLLLCLAMVPYVRYLAFSNHALIHYFFTYRAQTATVFALLMLVAIAARKGKKPRKKRS